MSQEYDVIIIGGGHNGLVTAAYLAEAGIKVLVLERRDIVGGACVTEELIPGFKFSTASMFVGMLQNKVIEDLELHNYGYQPYTNDPTDLFLFPEGQYLCVWQDTNCLLEEIAKFSEKDAEAYLDLQRFFDKYQDRLTGSWMRKPPDFADVISQFKTREEREALRTILFKSMAEFLDEKFESEPVKVMMASLASVGNAVSLRSRGNVFLAFRARTAETHGLKGVWGYCKGGMGAITRAMARSAEARGAIIRTNAEVDRILIKEGKAVGVVLASGEEVNCSVVASNADPKRTFLKMMEAEDLQEDFRYQMENIKMVGDFSKMFIALNGRPRWYCFEQEDPATKDQAWINIMPSIEYMEQAREDSRRGYPSKKPWFQLTLQSLTDPSLAPPGKHAMTLFIQHTPYNLKEGDWRTEKDTFSKRCIDTLSEYSSNLKDLIIDYRFFSPKDLEERFYLTESTMHHGWVLPDQMYNFRPAPGWSDYKTPVKNLYLCGSGAWPGGAVTGAPGHNAAHEIIKDWREGVIE